MTYSSEGCRQPTSFLVLCTQVCSDLLIFDIFTDHAISLETQERQGF